MFTRYPTYLGLDLLQTECGYRPREVWVHYLWSGLNHLIHKRSKWCSSYLSTISQHLILLPFPCSFGTTDKLALVRHLGKSGSGTCLVHTLYQFALSFSPTLFTFSVTLFQASRFSYCKLLTSR